MPARLRTPAFFPATRQTALDRLDVFLPEAGRRYQEMRNHDLGPGDRSNVSALSPFVRHRLITEAELVRRVHAVHDASAAYKFTSEVFWRTYFKGYLETRPSIWLRYQQAVRQQTDALKGGRAKAYEAAVEGRTGIDCFDAWNEELVTIGYVHNHARMWYASIWMHTLGLPWTLGADHFYRHLLCGDPASNTLSWRWVAGLHTKGKAYKATASNIARYTDGRFAPGDALKGSAVPMEDDWNGQPGPVPAGERAPDGPVFLLLHEDDLHPESLAALEGLDVVGLAAFQATDHRSPRGAGEMAEAFTAEALADGLARAGEAFGAEGSVVSPDALGDLVTESGAAAVVTPYAPVGPAADVLGGLDLPVPIHRLLRPEDAAAWPYCTKGFFALRKQIPGLMTAY